MQCQYVGCTNIGVYSCSNCGKLVCGKHAHVYVNAAPHCVDCRLQHERMMTGGQTYAEQRYEGDRIANKGCRSIFMSIPVLIIAGVLIAIGHTGAISLLGAFVGLIGLLIFLVGGVRFMIGAYKSY